MIINFPWISGVRNYPSESHAVYRMVISDCILSSPRNRFSQPWTCEAPYLCIMEAAFYQLSTASRAFLLRQKCYLYDGAKSGSSRVCHLQERVASSFLCLLPVDRVLQVAPLLDPWLPREPFWIKWVTKQQWEFTHFMDSIQTTCDGACWRAALLFLNPGILDQRMGSKGQQT